MVWPKIASELIWEAQKFQTFVGKDAPRPAKLLLHFTQKYLLAHGVLWH